MANTARPRFASITNEGALAPHENAFRRWSSPDIVPTMDAASMDAALIGFVPPVATERADTMAAHMPPTFTVYTAEQTRNAPMRRGSMPDYDEVVHTTHHDSDSGVGARTLLKWTGIGIVAGFAVLTALLVVLNVGDNSSRMSSARATIAKLGEPAAAPAKVESASVVSTPAADFEVDATPAPPPAPKKASTTTTTTAASKKKKSTKS